MNAPERESRREAIAEVLKTRESIRRLLERLRDVQERHKTGLTQKNRPSTLAFVILLGENPLARGFGGVYAFTLFVKVCESCLSHRSDGCIHCLARPGARPCQVVCPLRYRERSEVARRDLDSR